MLKEKINFKDKSVFQEKYSLILNCLGLNNRWWGCCRSGITRKITSWWLPPGPSQFCFKTKCLAIFILTVISPSSPAFKIRFYSMFIILLLMLSLYEQNTTVSWRKEIPHFPFWRFKGRLPHWGQQDTQKTILHHLTGTVSWNQGTTVSLSFLFKSLRKTYPGSY